MIDCIDLHRVNAQTINKLFINNAIFSLVTKYVQSNLIKLLLRFYRKYLLFVHRAKDRPGFMDFNDFLDYFRSYPFSIASIREILKSESGEQVSGFIRPYLS